MKINYPIKYTAMPIIEQVGWAPGLHELERKYNIVCYIVSKCYLISDLTKYTENGHSTKQYEVVFPYQLGEFNKWKRTIPSFNFCNGMCTNGNSVDLVFDSYEEALDYTKVKNEKIYNEASMYLPTTNDLLEKLQEKKKEFQEKLLEYKVLEEQILSRTSDMEIGKCRPLTNIIKKSNNDFKVMSGSIYKVFELFDSDIFVIHNISEDQYAKILKSISDGRVSDIDSIVSDAKALAVHKTKEDFILLSANKARGTYYINNNKLCCDFGLPEVSEEDFRNINENAYIFYTTETIEDILKSYTTYEDIDLDKEQAAVLKKVKNNKHV